jgi:monofunctional biosynthetic peptidoglycan transglycosylase
MQAILGVVHVMMFPEVEAGAGEAAGADCKRGSRPADYRRERPPLPRPCCVPRLSANLRGPSCRPSGVAVRPRKRGVLRWIWRWTWRLALAWLIGSVLLVVLLRFVPIGYSGFMLQRQASAWMAGERDFRLRQRWVPMRQVSSALPIALVAAEDQKFPNHHGFDVEAIRDAIEDAEDGERLRGASTISQQTAKNLFLWNGRSFVRKGLEAYFTVLIELCWSKQRILEVYLNVAEFGDGVYGAAAASEVYFRKTPGALTAHESARLAAVLPNPRRFRVDKPSSYVQRRVAWIERQAQQLGGPAYLGGK